MTEKALLAVIASFLAWPAAGQIHRCIEGGHTTYSQFPCGAPSATVADSDLRQDETPQETAARLQAEFEREIAARDAAVAAAAREEADRRAAKKQCEELLKKPHVLTIGWKGNVIEVEQYIKRHLNDPGSYQSANWGLVSRGCGGYRVRHAYRARNAFGGMVLVEQEFDLDHNGIVEAVRDIR